LVGHQAEPQRNFLEYLRSIPPGAAVKFPRAVDRPRPVVL